ncbi:MAG TPA: sigma-70 family RNA polymerase sigma factor [Gemmataceae bacterium]|nr:sigma-70 family RNA polymerase sigma factor [Gemmataceae bacterium]
MRAVIRHLRAAALLQKRDGPTDGQLLEAFLTRGEEAAFEALLRRHGPMVLGVCRRVLRNVHDADDAFQATFLVLARKAASVKPRDLVGGWLYGVAYRTAMKARAMSAKRRAKEKQAADSSRPEAAANETCEELVAELDHELNRLPDKYRVPVVLCELEGKGRKEVARLLGVPEGTLSWRLAHAKKLLANRLSRHKAALAVGTVTAVLSRQAVSAPLLDATAKTVLTAGAVPAKVLALTEGVLKAMLLTKLKISVCVAVLALLAGVGATGVVYRAAAQEPRRARTEDAPAQARRPPADNLESLRLEIEALRRELRIMSERVNALEAEVHGQKGRRVARDAEPRARGEKARRPAEEKEPRPRDAGKRTTRERPAPARDPEARPAPARDPGRERKATREGAPEGPIAEAEAALRKLRANPNDKQAAEELERALKSLKERDKPRERDEIRRK